MKKYRKSESITKKLMLELGFKYKVYSGFNMFKGYSVYIKNNIQLIGELPRLNAKMPGGVLHYDDSFENALLNKEQLLDYIKIHLK